MKKPKSQVPQSHPTLKSSPKFNLENYRHPDQFGNWLGYKLSQVDVGKAEVHLLVREDHLSPAGRLHGGVVSALFDFTFGAAVFTTLELKDFCSTVELKVNYLRPVELGDQLKAKVEIVYRGKRLCVLQGFLFKQGSKDPVAMATSTFNVVTGKV